MTRQFPRCNGCPIARVVRTLEPIVWCTYGALVELGEHLVRLARRPERSTG